jgi:hypothetical protein
MRRAVSGVEWAQRSATYAPAPRNATVRLRSDRAMAAELGPGAAIRHNRAYVKVECSIRTFHDRLLAVLAFQEFGTSEEDHFALERPARLAEDAWQRRGF